MCRCMGSTFVFCTVDQRNLVYMHTSPNVYASWVVPPSDATRATVATGIGSACHLAAKRQKNDRSYVKRFWRPGVKFDLFMIGI